MSHRPVRYCSALLMALVLHAPVARAQSTADVPEPTTLLPHPDAAWWLSAQLNVILQGHADFRSPYEGPHSLRGAAEHATSRVWTVHAGVERNGTDLLVDVESAGGGGISDALGIAGFTNLDVVRNPDLGSAPYLARLIVHHAFALASDETPVMRGPFALSPRVPSRRIDVRAGKMSVADFFDVNAPGSDSHLQFMNWTIDNNGAFDYAADTRGYTWGVMVSLETPRWAVRGGEMLMPKVANGIDLDWDVGRARGENVEGEWHPTPATAIRALAFSDKANLGSYREAIDAFLAHRDPLPDIEAHRAQGRREYGLGLNLEQAIGDVRVFGRLGWNDGHNESFAYTEVNTTALAGGDIAGTRWRRAGDRLGTAFVSNGLSALHREYLAYGGAGFLLGDGALTYGRELISETYYTAHVWRGIFAAGDVQHVARPGYNRDRGPVTVGGLRLHLEF